MAATYAFTVEGVEKDVQFGWTIDETANGRDTLTCRILSVDGSYRPALDDEVICLEKVGVTSSSVANPTVITTAEAHGVVTGQKVTIANHAGSTPSINGDHLATRTGATTLTIPVNVTVGGTGGILGRRLFGGNIHMPVEVAGLGLGSTAILTTIHATDFNGVADRRYVNQVLLAGTLKSQLTTLVSLISSEGFTLHPSQVNGPAMPDLPCDYLLLHDVLERMSVMTGYIWEFDVWQRLRMFLPNSEACPINVIDGDANSIGDISVEPTRENYANKVILRYSSEARHAYAFLSVTANFGNTETVIISSQTYTFQTVLTDSPGNVLIGGSVGASIDNLVAAVNRGAGAGSTYANSTPVNASVAAHHFQGVGDYAEAVKAIALTAGAAGNAIPVSEAAANASWIGEGSVATATLILGADQELTNVATASDAAEITAHGTWEVVIQAPDVTSASLASTLATAYLSTHIPVPKRVTYRTEKLGVRPGQTQTITIANRNVNATFLVTEVNTRDLGNEVVCDVTAIQSVLLQTVPNWRETYKEWSRGAGTPTSVSGGGIVIASAQTIYGFGGSQVEWARSATPTWISAGSIRIAIDTTKRGSTAATCYVRLRVRSGNVTARLRNITDGVTVGTSEAVSTTTFTTVSFAVTLTAGAKTYEFQLLPSLANVDVQMGSGYVE